MIKAWFVFIWDSERGSFTLSSQMTQFIQVDKVISSWHKKLHVKYSFSYYNLNFVNETIKLSNGWQSRGWLIVE